MLPWAPQCSWRWHTQNRTRPLQQHMGTDWVTAPSNGWVPFLRQHQNPIWMRPPVPIVGLRTSDVIPLLLQKKQSPTVVRRHGRAWARETLSSVLQSIWTKTVCTTFRPEVDKLNRLTYCLTGQSACFPHASFLSAAPPARTPPGSNKGALPVIPLGELGVRRTVHRIWRRRDQPDRPALS